MAAINELRTLRNMTAATHIVFGGASAGGIGAQAHIDVLAGMYAGTGTVIVGNFLASSQVDFYQFGNTSLSWTTDYHAPMISRWNAW